MKKFFGLAIVFYLFVLVASAFGAQRQQVRADLKIVDDHVGIIVKQVANLVASKRATTTEQQAIVSHSSVLSDAMLTAITTVSAKASDQELPVTAAEKQQVAAQIAKFDAEFPAFTAAINALKDDDGKKAVQSILAEFPGLLDTIHSEVK